MLNWRKSSNFASKMDSMRYEKEDLEEALRVLRDGGVIVYPTDTVWGIGCDATNEEAVRKVFALKQRADSKSMLVLLDSAAKLDYYVDVLPTASLLLEATGNDGMSARDASSMSAAEPLNDGKPLTIIYPKARHLAESLLAEDGSVGIRITDEVFSKALCARLRKPIVSTSANISGEPAAKCFREIKKEILDGADYVCRYRREDESEHEPSSIIKVNEDGSFVIIRS